MHAGVSIATAELFISLFGGGIVVVVAVELLVCVSANFIVTFLELCAA